MRELSGRGLSAIAALVLCLLTTGCAPAGHRADRDLRGPRDLAPGIYLDFDGSPRTFDPFESAGAGEVADLLAGAAVPLSWLDELNSTVIVGYSRNQRQEFDAYGVDSFGFLTVEIVSREIREEVFASYQISHPMGLALGLVMPFVITNFEFENQQNGAGDGELGLTYRFPALALLPGRDEMSPRAHLALRGVLILPTGDDHRGLGTGKDGTGIGATAGLSQRLNSALTLDLGASFHRAKTPGMSQGLSRPFDTQAVFLGVTQSGLGRLGVSLVRSEVLFVFPSFTSAATVEGVHFAATYTELAPYHITVTWSFDREPSTAQGFGLSFGRSF